VFVVHEAVNGELYRAAVDWARAEAEAARLKGKETVDHLAGTLARCKPVGDGLAASASAAISRRSALAGMESGLILGTEGR
jgi:hypothetical protein